MRITESRLRSLVRSEILREAAWTPEMADEKGVQFIVNNKEEGQIAIRVMSISEDMPPEIAGEFSARRDSESDGPCSAAWSVTWANMSPKLKGLGPLVYDLMMDLVSPDPLTCDRFDVKPDALRIWDFYLRSRTDVESVLLDNMKNEKTPAIDDNCWQESSMDYNEENWWGSSLSRAYRRKGGGTPTLDKLESFGLVRYSKFRISSHTFGDFGLM